MPHPFTLARSNTCIHRAPPHRANNGTGTIHVGLVKTGVGTTSATALGSAIAPDVTLTRLRPFASPDDSQFCLLALPSRQPLSLALTHSTLSCVTFSTDFTPSECPGWANAHTVSVEPYLALHLAPGETRAWQIRHGFET